MNLKTFIATLFVLVMVANAFGQSGIVPIVELKNRGLMGGVQNGRWVAPGTFRAKMKDESEFVLVGWNGVEEGGVTLGKKLPQEDVCEDFTRMEFELEQDHGVGIGTASNWNPVPRPLKTIDPNNAAYKTAVANFLRNKGFARPVVRIREALEHRTIRLLQLRLRIRDF